MLLEVEDLKIRYRTRSGYVHAVDGISFELEQGQTLGFVGESGCGKTTAGRALTMVMDDNAEIAGGRIVFDGLDLTKASREQLQAVRWNRIAMVPQTAMDALDPVYKLVTQFEEVLCKRGGFNRREARLRASTLFEMVGLEPERLNDYPHQFSGGMKQRAIIAMALALEPELVIADEPVTALDVIVQHQVLETFKLLKQELGLAVIMITHDISVVAQTCDNIAVMYAGRIVESGPTSQVMKQPLHPYNLGLQNAFPDLKHPADQLISIPGNPPDLRQPPPACRFASRCPFVQDRCRQEEPALTDQGQGHWAACHRLGDIDNLRRQAKEAATWSHSSKSAI